MSFGIDSVVILLELHSIKFPHSPAWISHSRKDLFKIVKLVYNHKQKYIMQYFILAMSFHCNQFDKYK